MAGAIPSILITAIILIAMAIYLLFNKTLEVTTISDDRYIKRLEVSIQSEDEGDLPAKKLEVPEGIDNLTSTRPETTAIYAKNKGCSINSLNKVSQPSSSSCQLHETNITIYMDSFKSLEGWMGVSYAGYVNILKQCPPLPGGGVCMCDINDKCTDSIFFYSFSSDLKFTKQHPDQIVITLTTEREGGSYDNFPPNFYQDVKVSYTRNSNIPVPYVCARKMALQLYNMGQPEIPTGKRGVVGMVSNCNNKLRNEYITELMKHIEIDQLGGCYANKVSSVSKTRHHNWVNTKLGFLAKSEYKYILAFENGVASDYVTEKVFHGLLSGLIPIYYGDRSVFDFIPGNHTIIFAPGYTPKQLADYINQIDNDEELSSSFFKDWDLKKMLTIHEQYCAEHFMCRVCRKVLEVRYHQKGCTNVKLMEKGDH